MASSSSVTIQIEPSMESDSGDASVAEHQETEVSVIHHPEDPPVAINSGGSMILQFDEYRIRHLYISLLVQLIP
ncbi:hypothetical protein SLEP1_g53544 [Rubroshorea leprosula]|uniref:Uncharacterized protein n=1 Tax=Rubroshorea leprosula TaxID=152421 RepID=A0AAV5MDL9_9ROSI|nr:hypothetical protein SLEP1_g53544 [Rubroshorea leprosula]